MTHIIPPFSSGSDPGYKFLRVFSEYHLTKGEIIDLWVEGGVAPYDWSITSDTLTLGAAQTDDQTNTIEADSESSADDDVLQTVTVTDAELNEVEIYCRICNMPCCDNPFSTLAFDAVNTEASMGCEEEITLYIHGGCAPFTWQSSDGAYVLGSAETDEHFNTLTSDECAEDDVTITVTDACSDQIQFVITASGTGCADAVAMDDDSTPDTITPGLSIYVYCENGVAPYDWSVEGTGYSLLHAQTNDPQNYLSCVNGTCDVDYDPYCVVTVTDACGNSDTLDIIADDGDWGTFVTVVDMQYDELCDVGRICDPAPPVKTSYLMDNSPDGIYGHLSYRYRRINCNWDTCYQSDPYDCCGGVDPGLCGYGKFPRGGLCDVQIVYGPCITREHSELCYMYLQEREWECG